MELTNMCEECLHGSLDPVEWKGGEESRPFFDLV